jgi:surfeit locus 1 family protein
MSKPWLSVQWSAFASSRLAAYVLLWLITVVAFLILSKLAWWQWQRGAEKTAVLQRIAQLQQHPLRLADLNQTTLPAVDGGRLVQLVRVLTPYCWLLDNQLQQGRPGYDVIVPVRQLDGRGPVLLVNLGWLAAPVSRAELPTPQLPATLQLDGLLRVAPGNLLLGQNVEQTAGYPQRIQSLLPDELAQLSQLPLLDAVLYQQHSNFVYHYQPVTLPPERHRAYALQWALLAIAVVVVAFFAARQRTQPGAHDD